MELATARTVQALDAAAFIRLPRVLFLFRNVLDNRPAMIAGETLVHGFGLTDDGSHHTDQYVSLDGSQHSGVFTLCSKGAVGTVPLPKRVMVRVFSIVL